MNRVAGIDLLRIISCFLVVCIHSCLNFKYGEITTNNILALIGQSFFRIGLPIFFMLSGFFILNSKCDFSLSSLYNRIIKIVIPFLFYSIVHWFVINNNFSISYSGALGYFEAITVKNSISVHFWFVYSLMGIYILSQAINFLFKDLDTKNSKIALCILALLFLYNGDFKDFSNVLPIPGFEKWTAYFIAGGLLARVRQKISLFKSLIIAITGYFLIIVLSVYYASNGKPLPYDNSFAMFVACSGLILFFSKLAIKNSNIIKYMGPASFGIYLIHACILKLVNPYLLPLAKSLPMINKFTLTFVISIIVFSISLLISLIATPALNKAIEKLSFKKAAY